MSTRNLAGGLGLIRQGVKSISSIPVPSSSQRRRASSIPSVPVAPSVGQSTSNIPVPVPTVPHRSEKKNGQCSVCLRTICLTTSGVIHKHGPGCPGSSQLPIPSSIQANGTVMSGATSDAAVPESSNNLGSIPVENSSSLLEEVCNARNRVIKYIPKASRIPAASKLESVLSQIISSPDNIEAWKQLLIFGHACFGVPNQRGGRRHSSSLASKVNKAIKDFTSGNCLQLNSLQSKPRESFKEFNLASRVSSKIEEGDIRGAVRIASSSETLAPFNDVTVAALHQLHPSRNYLFDQDNPLTSRTSTDTISNPDHSSLPLKVSPSDIVVAIKSFPAGSSCGLDGLKPQHLKDMTGQSSGDVGQRLLSKLSEFTNLCLSGDIPDIICPVFFGATLCALSKKNGGIRPIAVGAPSAV